MGRGGGAGGGAVEVPMFPKRGLEGQVIRYGVPSSAPCEIALIPFGWVFGSLFTHSTRTSPSKPLVKPQEGYPWFQLLSLRSQV